MFFRTALYGSFYKGQMVAGQMCRVLSGSGHCSYFCGVMKLAVTQPEGEVSKDANEIVDAIQSGNLQNIYTSPSGTLRR